MSWRKEVRKHINKARSARTEAIYNKKIIESNRKLREEEEKQCKCNSQH
jgi:hypothetical protein